MSERFHCNKNGEWEDYFNSKNTFRNEDILSVELKPAYNDTNNGCYYVSVLLKDGRLVCPDYTTWGTKEDAEADLKAWKELFGIGSNQPVNDNSRPAKEKGIMTLTFEIPASYKNGIATLTVARKAGDGLLVFMGGADLTKSDHWTIDDYSHLAPVKEEDE